MEITGKEIVHIKNGLAKEMARYKHEHDNKREKEVERRLSEITTRPKGRPTTHAKSITKASKIDGSFLIDEKRITLKLIVSRVLQRLNGQKLIGAN